MAIHKITRPTAQIKSGKSHKHRTSHEGHGRGKSGERRKPSPYAQIRGKVVERVEVSSGDEGCVIGIMFQDRTYLSFDVEVAPGISIAPELSDWKTGNYKPLKRWPHIQGD